MKRKAMLWTYHRDVSTKDGLHNFEVAFIPRVHWKGLFPDSSESSGSTSLTHFSLINQNVFMAPIKLHNILILCGHHC